MTEWLGGDQVVYPQVDGDLGKRMRIAATKAFSQGADAVVIIGSDCPQLTPERIELAFDALASHRVVIGPALDGGLYLLGLREMIPELFRPLQWESNRVFKMTRNRCRRLGIEVAELEPLNDIVRRTDLTDEVLKIINLTRSDILVESAY